MTQFRVWMMLGFITLSGCQALLFDGFYPDIVDHTSDKLSSSHCKWDWIYHPGLDLTRIGKDDWYSCRWNRWTSRICPPRGGRIGARPIPIYHDDQSLHAPEEVIHSEQNSEEFSSTPVYEKSDGPFYPSFLQAPASPESATPIQIPPRQESSTRVPNSFYSNGMQPSAPPVLRLP